MLSRLYNFVTAVCGGDVSPELAHESQREPLLRRVQAVDDFQQLDAEGPLSPVTLSMYEKLQAKHDEYEATCMPPSYSRTPVVAPQVVRPKAVSMKQAKEVHDLLEREGCKPLPLAPTAQKQKYHREMMGNVLVDPYHTQAHMEELEELIRRDVLTPFG